MNHKQLATLAEKLEFSNALRKQSERELSKEKIEHGKTQALVDELNDVIKKQTDKINGLQSFLDTKDREIEKLKSSLLAIKKANTQLLSHINKLELNNT